MSREVHVRFWESVRVRSPRATRLPLARQEKIFGRKGIELPRSTLTDWMLVIGQAVTPLVDRMGEWLKTTDILASDAPAELLSRPSLVGRIRQLFGLNGRPSTSSRS
jgi:hypothetical protein